MSYDPHVPRRLRETQEWFGSITSRPLTVNEGIQEMSPRGVAIAEEALQWINPSPTLLPHQRIEIYNQQYWWRILRALRDNFPLTVRIFGADNFDREIGVPYICANRPCHWSLEALGSTLPQWLQKSYEGKDQALVHDAAAVDWAMAHSFLASEQPALNPATLSEQEKAELGSRKLYLQEHVHLLKLRGDLFSWRRQLVEEGEDYWINQDFPKIDKSGPKHFVVFRTAKNLVSWKGVNEEEWKLLSAFKQGASLEEACQSLESVGENIAFWMQEWTMRGWLC